MEYPDKKFSHNFLVNLVANFTNYGLDFSIKSWQVLACGREVVGYQGEYYKLSVKYKRHNAEKYLYFFIKCLPRDAEKAKKLMEVGYFHREYGIYTRILAKFDKLQVNANYHPKAALSSNIEIILEDLHMKQYSPRRPRDAFDRHHCLTALKSLAHFHAGSIIYEDIKSKKAKQQVKIEEKFKDILQECGYIYNGWFIAGMEAAMSFLSKNKKYHKLLIEPESHHQWRHMFRSALDLCRPSKTHRNVLCHRDLWANNLMFKYNDRDLPVNCVFVDYQAAICMPPAGDVVSLIYLNVERHNRHSYYEEFIKHYYDSLESELYKHNLKILDVYLPFHEYKKHCETYKHWALVQSLLLHQLALLRDDDIKFVQDEKNYDKILNFNRNGFVFDVMNRDPLYKQRMMENVEEFVELYLL